jgi:hypothetical protein
VDIYFSLGRIQNQLLEIRSPNRLFVCFFEIVMVQGKKISFQFQQLLSITSMMMFGTLLLCLPAIWNGFPLVYSDTGAYLATAFEGKLPMARPTGYGLLIRYTALGDNVWLPIVVQSLLFSWLLMRAVRVALPSVNLRISYSISMVVIAGLTGMTWYASQLMPDIFTGLVVLGFFILLWDPEGSPMLGSGQAGRGGEMKWIGRCAVGFVLYWFCFSHYSHAALLLVLVGLGLGYFLLQKLGRRQVSFGLGGLCWALVPAILAILTFYYVNYANGLGWRMTRSSHVFTMARLSETGLLADYLHETCAEKQWSLCPYADSLPGSAADFIWSDASPFKKTGYWEGSRPEYDSLLTDFFSRGKYLGAYLKESAKAGVQQVAALSVGEGVTPYNESSSPYKFFARAMPDKVPAYVASKQFEREFSFGLEKVVLQVTMVVSVVILLGFWILRGRQMGKGLAWFSIVAVVGYVVNAFLTGALANVYSRLQSRIAWVIPLAACFVVMEMIRRGRK